MPYVSVEYEDDFEINIDKPTLPQDQLIYQCLQISLPRIRERIMIMIRELKAGANFAKNQQSTSTTKSSLVKQEITAKPIKVEYVTANQQQNQQQVAKYSGSRWSKFLSWSSMLALGGSLLYVVGKTFWRYFSLKRK